MKRNPDVISEVIITPVCDDKIFNRRSQFYSGKYKMENENFLFLSFLITHVTLGILFLFFSILLNYIVRKHTSTCHHMQLYASKRNRLAIIFILCMSIFMYGKSVKSFFVISFYLIIQIYHIIK